MQRACIFAVQALRAFFSGGSGLRSRMCVSAVCDCELCAETQCTGWKNESEML